MSDLNRIESSSHSESTFSAFEDNLTTPSRGETAPRLREGLPPAYKMRADAHYVDQLDAASAVTVQSIAVQSIEFIDESSSAAIPSLVESVKRHGVLEPLLVQKHDRRYRLIAGKKRLAAAITAGLREVPCLIHRVDDDQARLLASAAKIPMPQPPPARESKANALPAIDLEVANCLSAVTSCAALLTETMPRLTRTMAADLIRAEAWRAICVLHAARILTHGISPTIRFVSPRDLVQRVVQTLETNVRLRGIDLDPEIHVTDETVIRADSELLLYALSGLALTMCSLLEGVNGARVIVAALPEPVGRVTLSVSQDSVAVPEAWPADLIESALENPGPSSSSISILALRRIAETYEGRFSVTRLTAGCSVAIDLPLETPRRA